MKKLKLVLFVVFGLLIQSNGFADNVDISLLNLSATQMKDYEKLPPAVKTLMLNEAKMKHEMKKFSQSKVNKHNPCDDDDDDNDDVTCVSNCIERWSDGSCREYGADHCGPGAACVSNCIERWSDGSCREYGSDVCY